MVVHFKYPSLGGGEPVLSTEQCLICATWYHESIDYVHVVSHDVHDLQHFFPVFLK